MSYVFVFKNLCGNYLIKYSPEVPLHSSFLSLSPPRCFLAEGSNRRGEKSMENNASKKRGRSRSLRK